MINKNRTPLLFSNLFVLLISVFLLTYVIIRAYNLSFTHDESLSYMIIEGDIAQMNSANNHKLNTLLMSLSKILFGTSELSLRLPNVLSFVLFLLGCFLLFKKAKKNWLVILGFCMMTINPFMIEFFSLARGYGLSLAFMLLSLFFLFETEKDNLINKQYLRFSSLSLLFGILALYSNLSMINYLISLQIILIIKYWINRRKYIKSVLSDIKFLIIIAISCIPLFFEIEHLLRLKELNQLYFGGTSFTEGIDSLLHFSMSPFINNDFIFTLIKITFLLSLIIGGYLIIREKKMKGPLFLIFTLIVLLFLGLHLESFIFGAKFPLERTALFYIPILAVFIYHLLLHLTTIFKFKEIYFNILTVLMVAIFLMNFISESNITYTKVWRYDAHTKDAMKIIKDLSAKDTEKNSISSHWLFEPTINFYIRTWEINIQPANRQGVNLDSDFIYRLNEDSKLENFKTIRYYEDIKSEVLIKDH